MRKKIEFLRLLFKRTNCHYGILDFLKTHMCLTEDEYLTTLEDPNRVPEAIADLLEQRLVKERLQLVHYEWILLPNEHMKLTIVAETATVDFTFGV